jgi:hypothetical protein
VEVIGSNPIAPTIELTVATGVLWPHFPALRETRHQLGKFLYRRPLMGGHRDGVKPQSGCDRRMPQLCLGILGRAPGRLQRSGMRAAKVLFAAVVVSYGLIDKKVPANSLRPLPLPTVTNSSLVAPLDEFPPPKATPQRLLRTTCLPF